MLGDINVDSIWPVACMPEPGRDGLVETITNGVGGAILNSAIVLDNLGAETILLGCIGKDLWAEFIRDSLHDTHVDLSQLQTDDTANTGLDFILVTEDGERTMFGYRGANKYLRADLIDTDIFQKAGMLHISGYALLESPQRDAAMQAAAYAKHNQVPISIDTGLEPVLRNKEDFLELLPALEICISGEEEVSCMLGSSSAESAAEALLAQGVKLAAIKLGGRGSYIATTSERFFCPAFPISARDTTGAGDAFSAGLIYGRTQGLGLAASASLASALGALAASVEGAGLALPGREDLIALLKSTAISNDVLFERAQQELTSYFSDEGRDKS